MNVELLNDIEIQSMAICYLFLPDCELLIAYCACLYWALNRCCPLTTHVLDDALATSQEAVSLYKMQLRFVMYP